MRYSMRARGIIPQSRWKRSALAFSAAAFATFIINLSFILWATTHTIETISDEIGVLANGNCQKIKNWNTGIHVVINSISTVLLAGSNYCMQCLIAPTRAEIDRAHARQKWLDIGIPSIRNFSSISWKRRIIWMLLAVSSLPLHLIFNSIVFTSTSTNRYSVYAISLSNFDGEELSTAHPILPNDLDPFAKDGKDEFFYLNTRECLEVYGKAIQSVHGDLVIVARNETALTGVVQRTEFSGGIENPYDWICAGNDEKPCDEQLSSIKKNETWKPWPDLEVRGCYSQKTTEHCKFLFSSRLCWTVTALNLVKGVLMLFVVYGNSERPLLTIGDAVESFLIDEDKSTKTMGLASQASVSTSSWNRRPPKFNSKRRRKLAVASYHRWVAFIGVWVIALNACLFLTVYYSTQSSVSNITKYGLGQVHADTIIFMDNDKPIKTLLANVLLANTPQTIMSFIYFDYNAFLTSISLVTEWDRFGKQQKGLRVSSQSQGRQRQKYFLQLPYRYSVPLNVFSSGIHWLLSQSVFLVNIEVWDSHDKKTDSITSCGWSPIGCICVVVAGTIMIGFLLMSASRRLRFGGIPVAASCSAAISAACHPAPNEGSKMWTKALRWGVVSENHPELPHCSFSSRKVDAPIEGMRYR